MYSDCTDENRCEGCNRCTCTRDGTWTCETVREGCNQQEEEEEAVDERLLDDALNDMLIDLQQNNKEKPEEVRYVPKPKPPPETIIVKKFGKLPEWDDLNETDREEEKFALEDIRWKRSVEEKNANKKEENGTITYHHTVDELNEDTLKNTNASGTVPAAKIDMIPLASRRSTPLKLNNASTPLQIDYLPPLQNQHAADNKVDSSAPHDDQLDLLVHHKMYKIIGNQSQGIKDKDLSKLVVNELKGGAAETIGDKNSPVISNITFTPENDTLTAMAFIAGNLLNKLWNIEKDSDDSLETEHIKHQKIDDLLDLFKEPLNLRQETFLKNALEHLSSAIENKNIANVSLCENVEELKKTSGIIDEPKQPKSMLKSGSYENPVTNAPYINKKTIAAEALNKIGNVLDLIKKYEQTQITLNEIKNNSNLNSTIRKSIDPDENAEDLTKDEKTTLNVFGHILESLTKLIIPNKTGKKVIKGIKSKSLFVSDNQVKDRFMNLNLTDMSLTTKDKVVLDYLTHIQNNPNCLLNKHKEKPLLPDVEGDILLNLSEFLKIKSMSDLIKIVDSENIKEEKIMRIGTTESYIPSFKNVYTTEKITTEEMTTENENKISRYESTKQKLKDHLKTIVQDLVELQNISGKSMNGQNIEIAKALPCIYNLLNNKKNSINGMAKTAPKIKLLSKAKADPVNKVTEIVNNLKKELKHNTLTRRTNVEFEKRPKSAIVWERTVKSLGSKKKIQTRKNFQSDVPKSFSFNDIKTTINKIENSGSNTYKSIAYLTEVPPSERLLLLKTLALDTKKYISILNAIKQSTETVTTLPLQQYTTLSEFVENVEINLNLNEKVIRKLKKDDYLSNQEVKTMKTSNYYNAVKEVEQSSSIPKTVKLTRDQIINQLIKNRMLYYLKMKEEKGEQKSEINVSMAEKILLYLEIGNDKLARELFNIFISQKRKNPMNISSNPVSDSVKYEINPQQVEIRRAPQIPNPWIQFEEPKKTQEPWLNEDQLMKQLMNIKNMRV